MNESLRLPARHPYLAVTPEEIARGKARAARYEWAREALQRLVGQADSLVARPWGRLPEKGDTAHRGVSGQLLTAGLAFAFTRERRYADWVRDGLLAYADLYPGLPLTRDRCKLFTQSSLYEATWIVPVAQAYDLVADSGAFTESQKRHVENDLLRASLVCFKIDDYENDARIRDLHYRCYNFQAWHLSAIGLVGLAVCDPGLVDYAVNSRYGFRHLVAHDIRDDGLFWERSVGYHQFVLSALLPFTEAMARCGVDLYALTVPPPAARVPGRSRDEDAHYVTDTSDRPKSLRLMFEAPFYLAFPDLSYIALGDSDRGPLRASWQHLVGYHRYRDPRLAWLLARDVPLAAEEARREGAPPARASRNAPGWHWLVYDAPQLEEAGAPSPGGSGLWRNGTFANTGVYRNGCSLFPSSGVAVLRQTGGDFTARPETTAVALSYGPYGGGHGHPDKLSIAVYAQGRQWIPHFGSMPYESRWKAEWTAHTISHNTLVVDGVSQKPTGERNVTWPVDHTADRALGRLERFDPRRRLVAASSDSVYEGLTLRRAVRLAGNCVIDRFEVRPSADAVEHPARSNNGSSRGPLPDAAGAPPRRFDYVLHVDGAFAESSVPLSPRGGPLGERCGYQHVEQRQGASVPAVTSLTFTSGVKRLRIWVARADAAPVELLLADGPTNEPEGKMPMLLLRQRGTTARFITVIEPVDARSPLRGVRVEKDQVILERTAGVERVPLG